MREGPGSVLEHGSGSGFEATSFQQFTGLFAEDGGGVRTHRSQEFDHRTTSQVCQFEILKEISITAKHNNYFF